MIAKVVRTVVTKVSERTNFLAEIAPGTASINGSR